RAVEIVAVRERHSQPVGERPADGRLAGTGNAHDHHHGCRSAGHYWFSLRRGRLEAIRRRRGPVVRPLRRRPCDEAWSAGEKRHASGWSASPGAACVPSTKLAWPCSSTVASSTLSSSIIAACGSNKTRAPELSTSWSSASGAAAI